jgi:flagellar assembly protein FliH
LSSKVFKNHQINLGIPLLVKVPIEDPARPDGATLLYSEHFDDETDTAGAASGPNGPAGPAGPNGPAGPASHAGQAADVDRADPYEPADTAEPAEPIDPVDAAVAEAGRITGEANARAEAIISEAKTEAGALLQSSRREADAYGAKARGQADSDAAGIREAAGREGELEGRREGREAYDSLIAEAGRIRADAEEKYRKLLAGAEGDMLELVLKVSRKVIGDEIAFNRNSIIMMIKDALGNCTNREELILKISPEDYEFVMENKNNLLSMVEGIDSLEIRRDLSLGPGSCFIETPFGSLDAGADTRLSKIEDALYRILSASRPDADELIA